MVGAYCPDCRELGPDLTLDGHVIPPGAVGRISFTCGRCHTSWTWDVEATAAGFVYSNPRRVQVH